MYSPWLSLKVEEETEAWGVDISSSRSYSGRWPVGTRIQGCLTPTSEFLTHLHVIYFHPIPLVLWCVFGGWGLVLKEESRGNGSVSPHFQPTQVSKCRGGMWWWWGGECSDRQAGYQTEEIMKTNRGFLLLDYKPSCQSQQLWWGGVFSMTSSQLWGKSCLAPCEIQGRSGKNWKLWTSLRNIISGSKSCWEAS